MSWLRCDSCDALIDTDEEPGAYVETRDVWLCRDCNSHPAGELDFTELERRERHKTHAHEVFGQKRWDKG